jgi:hypothetical protein
MQPLLSLPCEVLEPHAAVSVAPAAAAAVPAAAAAAVASEVVLPGDKCPGKGGRQTCALCVCV